MLTVSRKPLARELRSRSWAYTVVLLAATAIGFISAFLLDQRDLLERHLSAESGQIPWVVFLKDHADRALLEESLRAFPGIGSLRFVTKEEAYESVQKDAALSQSLTLTGRNPFPESFDVRWAPAFLRDDFLTHAAEKTQTLDGVDAVDYDASRVRRLDVLQRFFHALQVTLTASFWSGALLFFLLLGRLAFYPQGPFPFRRLFLSTAVGAVGGTAGVVLAEALLFRFVWTGAAAGAAAGLLSALIAAAFDEF